MYVENVRSVFGISERAAQRYCDTAVRQGIFSKFIEVRCPNGSVGASAESEAKLPETVHCWQEEDGDFTEAVFSTRELPKAVFYRLNDEAISAKPDNIRASHRLRSRTTH
jgi:hypothetical protein